jgi:hypothetical protein
MSSNRSSSLAALPVANSSSSDIDSKDSVDRPNVPGVVPGGSRGGSDSGSDRMVSLLERLVDRVERLEASQVGSSRSVRDRPPTPALPATVPASLSLSGGAAGPIGSSMSAYLSGGHRAARRVPSVLARPAHDSALDSDSEEEQESSPAAPAAATVGREHPLFAALAPSIIQDVGKQGFQAWMRSEAPKEEWNKLRNRNECEVLAQVLDALVLDRDSDSAIEILVRRFVGVKHADHSGNWNFADVLAKDMPKRTLLRPAVLSCVLREAKNLTLLESGGYRASGSQQTGRSDRGRDGRDTDRQFGRDGDRQFNRDGRGSGRGGRFAQPNAGASGGGGGRFQSNANSHSSSSNSNSNSTSSSAASAGGGSSQGAGRSGNGQ